jgi:hypothetical protein
MSELPFGFTIGPPVPELRLGKDRNDAGYDWRSSYGQRIALGEIEAAKAFPQPVEVSPEEQMFGCSGSLDSSRYHEATKFRAMSEMGWEEARIALNRLVVPLRYDRGKVSQYVALAEFALTATGFTGFVGRRGEHGVKLREELGDARNILSRRLDTMLQEAERNAAQLSRPITLHGVDMRDSHEAFATAIVRAFWALVPSGAAEKWVRIVEATPDQAVSALDHLRATMATWEERRPVAAGILGRLSGDDTPTAAEYAEAIHIADMLVFTSTKLLTLYAGLMHSMPIYRMYPAISEQEAIALWWPWGRPVPLVDSVPPRPPKPRKQQLDPSIITAKRPQDVVREVMQKTGINRTTAQRMTASMRAKMRSDRQRQARWLLMEGLTKAEVARRVGLSPSRLSALFRGERFSDSRRAREMLRTLAINAKHQPAS